MPTATLTTKGQITLPKEIREYLHAKPGTKIDFSIRDNGEIIMKAANRSVRELKGILAPYVKRPITIEEMNEAIAKGWAGQA